MIQRYLIPTLAVLWVCVGTARVPHPFWFLTLPIVLLTTIYLNTRRLPWRRQGFFLLVGLPIALLLYLAALETPLLLRLLKIQSPQPVTNLASLGWSILNGTAILALLTLAHQQQDIGWRATLTGVAAGGALLICLAYPVYSGLVNTYIPTRVFASTRHLVAITLYGLAALCLLFGLGPATVVWSRAHKDGQRLVAGTVAGLAAGVIVYALAGIVIAGVAAHAPLYDVAVTRLGFEESAYPARLGLAVNQAYPFTLAAWWLLIGGVPLISALAAWVMTPRAGSHTNIYPSVWPLPLLILTPPIFYVGLVIQMAITTLLSYQIAETMKAATSWWNPLWLPGAIGWQLWLAAIGVQVLGLVWLLRFPTASRLRGAAAWSGYLSGIGTLLLLLLFSFINPYLLTKQWPMSLFMALLNLALIGAGWRLRHAPTPITWQEERPSLLTWITTSGWAMVIALIIIYPFVAAALALVHVAVVMIEQLSQVTAPPPGVTWLVMLLEDYAQTQVTLTAALLAAACCIGGVVGYLIHLFVSRHR